MEKVKHVIVGIVSIFIMWLVYQITLPTLSLAYMTGFFYIAFCVIIIGCNIALWLYDFGADETIAFAPIYVPIILAICIFIICAIFGSKLFNATKMQRQIGNVEVINYDDMIRQIDTSQIPIVDEDLAHKQADKKIGEDIALGSRVELGDAAIQEVNGEIVYVVPLEHTGFFKWNNNHTTPGYIKVSASNPNKVDFVTSIDGKELKIQYQESSYFSYDLKRYIRNNGFRTVGLTEYTFEIDDTGRPYYVVTTFKNTTIWGNPEATGVVIVDAQTGEIKWYSVDETPKWVDIIQPQDFIENQIDNWGTLVHGAINFSNLDKIEKTSLTLTIYVDGDCYYFTGMTSVGSDDSCVGFIMTNTRNKNTYIAYMSGATENAAMKSAEGLVSDFGYKPTEPLPLNVNGIPTFVMALKDGEGLIKSYAMVNIENYSIAAKGSTLAETSRSYLQAVTRNSTTQVFSDEAYGYTFEGNVVRISNTVEDGTTQYYLVLDGKENMIFTASYVVSNELSITRDGDKVKLSYIDDKNGLASIIEFDNVAFATPKSEQQENRDEMDKDTSVIDSEKTQITDVNPTLNEETWNNLTDEEKAKILEEFQKNNQ